VSKNTHALKRLRQELGHQDALENVISDRLRLARTHHLPALTAQQLVDRVRDEYGLDFDHNTVHKIENQQRGASDYEVKFFARVLKVSADWLLGLSDEGGPKGLTTAVIS
jgi:hypothetical protein